MVTGNAAPSLVRSRHNSHFVLTIVNLTRSATNTTQLGDLPNELLLNIAKHLRNGSQYVRRCQRDLCNLTLTAKKYRPVAQEALHYSVVIRAPAVEIRAGEVRVAEPLDPSRIVLLCRTLLRRPDLARKDNDYVSLSGATTHGIRALRARLLLGSASMGVSVDGNTLSVYVEPIWFPRISPGPHPTFWMPGRSASNPASARARLHLLVLPYHALLRYET